MGKVDQDREYQQPLTLNDFREQVTWMHLAEGLSLTLRIDRHLESVGKLLPATPIRGFVGCMWRWEPTSCGSRMLLPRMDPGEATSWITAWLEAEGVLTRAPIMLEYDFTKVFPVRPTDFSKMRVVN
jgi:hypothetical protein